MSGVYNSANYIVGSIPLMPLTASITPTELLESQQMLSKYNYKYNFVRKENVFNQNSIFTPNLRFRKLKNLQFAQNNNIELKV
jgi:hypothetical protein